jgi:hypothetical protein
MFSYEGVRRAKFFHHVLRAMGSVLALDVEKRAAAR